MMKVEYGALKEAGLAADDRQATFYSLPGAIVPCRVDQIARYYRFLSVK
jgi:hypothetical protein